MRIALLGICHETNTFSPIVTNAEKFERDGTLRGSEIITAHATAQSSLSGFLAAGREQGAEVIPLIWAWANPSGTVTAEAFDTLSEEATELLRLQGPWDAVFMAQHGAGVSQEHPDLEAEFLRRVRTVVGSTLPIGVSFDLHANVSPEAVALATVLVGYQTNPHVDAFETARECGELTISAARGEISPVMELRQVDAVISILRQATAEEPMRSILHDAHARRSEPGVLSVSVFEGYPYADVAHMGMSCLVVTDGDREMATTHAEDIAATIWQARESFTGVAIQAAEAVHYTSPEGPVLLLDVGDNIGAGGDGRSTALLEAMMDAGVGDAAIILHEPTAVETCLQNGIDAQTTVTVGRPGEQRQITGRVRTLSDGHFEDPTPTHGGYRFFDAGPTAVLEMESRLLVVLTTKVVLPTSRQQLISSGIDLRSLDRIVAKGVVSPQASYGPVCSKLLLVDTPGVTSADLAGFTYISRRRPLYPLD